MGETLRNTVYLMRDRMLDRVECGKLCVALLCVISTLLGEAICIPGEEQEA
jgi:hypothetical protein